MHMICDQFLRLGFDRSGSNIMMFLPKVNPMTAVADGHGGLKEQV